MASTLDQCAFEDGMVTYTRCTRLVVSGEGLHGGKVYCERHAEFEPTECAKCGEETSEFQDREGTHECDPGDKKGCEYGECHNLAEASEENPSVNLSRRYCKDHAGPVTDEYADVTTVWEGAVNNTLWHVTSRAKIEAEVDDVKREIREGNVPKDEYGGAVVSLSFHTHEFERREDMEKDFECSCESYETEFDSTKTCAHCDEDRKDRNGDEHRCFRYECGYKGESPVCEGMTDNSDGLCDACDASNAEPKP
jgi:hypothetical protein